MLKKTLIAFAALLGLVFVIGLVLPSRFRVERSTTIHAPSEAVYAAVANLERWQDWAPWNARTYPGTRWRTGGAQVGVGAVHSWSGEDVGNGTLSLTQADPKTGVAYAMSTENGRYVMHGRISFEPTDQGTRVTWVDEGDLAGNPLAHSLVPLIESRLGGNLEEGLAQLKKQVEANPLPAATKPEPTPAPLQATAPSPLPAPAPPSAPPAEGSQAAAPPAEGTPAATPGEPASPATATPPEGEPTQAGASAPSSEPAPVESAPSISTPAPAPTPAPAGEQVKPTGA
jgi:hypothetical protein